VDKTEDSSAKGGLAKQEEYQPPCTTRGADNISEATVQVTSGMTLGGYDTLKVRLLERKLRIVKRCRRETRGSVRFMP